MSSVPCNEFVRVLEYGDREEWRKWIEAVGNKDIFFSPEYGYLYEQRGEGKACLFVYGNGEAIVCYPFLLRQIDFPLAVKELAPPGTWFDITSPYGYCGPLSNAEPGPDGEALIARFEEKFGAFCRERRIITEFVRFHPLLGNQILYPGVEPTNIRSTISVDLRVNEETLLSRYSPDHRRALRKIGEHPVSFREVDPAERNDTFLRLYRETMGELEASEYYYFDEKFCLESTRLLEGQIAMFEVLYGEETICSATVWIHKPYMHGFLLGWDRKYKKLNATKYLIHNISLWGIRNGYSCLHLGGGYAGNDDPLYQFKKGFGQDNEYEYFIGTKVHFPELYDRMADLLGKQAFEGYFPIYRHPLIDKLVQNTLHRDAI